MSTPHGPGDALPAGLAALAPWMPAQAAWRWLRLSEAGPALARLSPDEALSVAAAVPRRRLEFAAGRWCAHAALADIGRPAGSIPVGAHRAPSWPEGVVGSISHDDALCIAAVAPRQALAGLGLDIERADRLQPAMADLVCRPAERHRFGLSTADHPAADGGTGPWRALARIFSIKEALFKALHPALGEWIEFDDVEVVRLPEQDAGAFEAMTCRPLGPLPAGHCLTGGSVLMDGRVLALATLPPAALTTAPA